MSETQSPATADYNVGVPYLSTRCPCGSTRTLVTNVWRRASGLIVRRHRCRACGFAFKSYEEIEDDC